MVDRQRSPRVEHSIELTSLDGAGLSDYEKSANRQPHTANWLRAMKVFSAQSEKSMPPEIKDAVSSSLRARPTHDSFGSCSLELAFPENVQMITGHKLAIPVLRWNSRERYDLFLQEQIGSSDPQLCSLALAANPQEFFTRLNIPYETEIRPVHFVALCAGKEEGPSAEHPQVLLQSVYAINPHWPYKGGQDGKMLDEMAGMTGIHATKRLDGETLRFNPDLWMEKLKTIEGFTPEFFQVFRLFGNDNTLGDAAKAMSLFVTSMTSRMPNSEFTGMCMNAFTLKDLQVNLNKRFPQEYPSPEELTDQQHRAWANSITIEESVSRVLTNAQTYPDAYTTHASGRGLSSTWQKDVWGVHGNATFFRDDAPFGPGQAAIRLLNQVWQQRPEKKRLDPENIEKFHIKWTKRNDFPTVDVTW